MDPFDDVLPVAPAARSRPGAKFVPKAKLKQLPRKEIPTSEHATSSKDGISGNECQNAVASTVSMLAEESMGSIHHTQVEIPNYCETGNAKQVGVKGDSAVTVDDSATTMSEVDADQNSTSFLKSAYGAELVDFEVGSVTNFDPETNVNNGTAQPVHPDNALDRMKEPPKNGEGSFFDSNKGLELIDNSLRVSTDLGFKSVSDNKAAEFELDPFSNILPDPGARNAHKFQPKIKSRPRACNTPAIASASSNVMTEKSVELPTSCKNDFQSFQSSGDGSGGLNQSTSLPLPASEILRTTDLPNKFDYMSSSIPFSEDNKSLESAIPSQLDSLNAMLSEDAVHNGTRDWPSSYGKSSGEAADIFYGLESLDDFITHAATDTGKPALHSFNEKGAEENFATPASNSINSFGECVTTQDTLTFDEGAVPNEDDTHTNNRSETEEAVDLNPDCPGDDVFDYHSMKSDEDPTSGIPVHDELTNVADSPRLADLLQADVTREKQDSNEKKKDDSTPCSVRKNRRSSIAGEEDKGGKTSRQLRKQAARKPANSSLNEDVEDNDDLDPPYNSNGDELQENDDDYEVDYSSKKRRASTSSKKKSVAKSGKTSQKLDKALLEIPEDELDPRTLPIKDIILLAEHRERLAKKEAMTSGASSTCQRYSAFYGGDPFHEAGANNEEEFSGSEDDRDPYEDQATEVIPTASTLFNYQSFMEKAPRGKWSKQDTGLFYEAVRELGTDFSMIQQLFPGKTRHQIKLKYKKEERENPSLLTDAVNNRAKDHSHYKLLIERLQDASNKAEVDPSRDASDFMAVDEVLDLTPATNNEEAAEVATTKQEDDVKAQEDSVAVPSPEQSDDSDDDFQKWSQYKSVFDE
ncbi:uncharacterized protein LOC109810960 isoform X3 [Cajanus cajan]|uniref:uncharacterized protein LOC109810960 isoform X3 n=1 Tax=Cajanus cajan TaxID=3821 RepID=UPI0010FB10F0|nr:uncharacterized protein LOC109810960 isoform X3 [Cajanus cajan]